MFLVSLVSQFGYNRQVSVLQPKRGFRDVEFDRQIDSLEYVLEIVDH